MFRWCSIIYCICVYVVSLAGRSVNVSEQTIGLIFNGQESKKE